MENSNYYLSHPVYTVGACNGFTKEMKNDWVTAKECYENGYMRHNWAKTRKAVLKAFKRDSNHIAECLALAVHNVMEGEQSKAEAFETIMRIIYNSYRAAEWEEEKIK